MTFSASVFGASGFTGGELLRLLDGHPQFEITQATSRKYFGRSVGYTHPNLRDLKLKYSSPEKLEPVDVLFVATPHGVSMSKIDAFSEASNVVVDLSADFRLKDPQKYDEYYDGHSCPELLEKAVYGLPEIHRDDLKSAKLIACGGCNSTVTILGLYPLFKSGLLTLEDIIVADIKVGSSEGGASRSTSSHHAIRSGIVRPYAPISHRHEAEIEQELGAKVAFTVHAVDMIRGAAATCHIFPTKQDLSKSLLWKAYLDSYGEEPFVRLLSGTGGNYRYPEPKVVAGTNNVEIAFEIDERNNRIVVFSAIDNMMKGSAGQAIHAANIAFGIDETIGLSHRSLHPTGAP
jgi:N-acetyl-gamma-glutamyl-phosphate/LysW-gamma-L-alpha-aminoadipyl-6-phosphate reductase